MRALLKKQYLKDIIAQVMELSGSKVLQGKVRVSPNAFNEELVCCIPRVRYSYIGGRGVWKGSEQYEVRSGKRREARLYRGLQPL